METLKLLHMYPNILDLYGDNGNVEILKYRCQMRNINLEIQHHNTGENVKNFSDYDIIYLGGGADHEQLILANDLNRNKDLLQKAYDNGVFFLLICGGYQLMGKYYKDSFGNTIHGAGIFDYYTVASTNKGHRCIGNVVLENVLNGNDYKIIGFENHGGQTQNVSSPFGNVILGNGNSFSGNSEGYMEKNVIATYLHGPLLSKNPLLCDHIIKYCMERKLKRKYKLKSINDSLENDCRQQLLNRLLK